MPCEPRGADSSVLADVAPCGFFAAAGLSAAVHVLVQNVALRIRAAALAQHNQSPFRSTVPAAATPPAMAWPHRRSAGPAEETATPRFRSCSTRTAHVSDGRKLLPRPEACIDGDQCSSARADAGVAIDRRIQARTGCPATFATARGDQWQRRRCRTTSRGRTAPPARKSLLLMARQSLSRGMAAC